MSNSIKKTFYRRRKNSSFVAIGISAAEQEWPVLLKLKDQKNPQCETHSLRQPIIELVLHELKLSLHQVLRPARQEHQVVFGGVALKLDVTYHPNEQSSMIAKLSVLWQEKNCTHQYSFRCAGMTAIDRPDLERAIKLYRNKNKNNKVS